MVPVFVSIGESCAVKYQIQKHLFFQRDTFSSNTKRCFFDYVYSTFDAVLKLFSGEVEISPNNIVDKGVYEHSRGKHGKYNVAMELSCGVTCIHDIEDGYTETELQEFIEALRRRVIRTTAHVMSEKSVFFIHYARGDKLPHEKCQQFLDLLHNLNENHKCVLVSCYNGDENDTTTVQEKFISFPLKKRHFPTEEWKRDDLNWGELFQLLHT